LKTIVLVQEIIIFGSDGELRIVKCWVLHVSVCVRVHVGSVLLMYRYCVVLLFSREFTINVVSNRVTFHFNVSAVSGVSKIAFNWQ